MDTNKKNRELISALCDGEIPDVDQELALAALDGPTATRPGTLYHQIGDALRAEPAPDLSPGFAERLAARLAADPCRGKRAAAAAERRPGDRSRPLSRRRTYPAAPAAGARRLPAGTPSATDVPTRQNALLSYHYDQFKHRPNDPMTSKTGSAILSALVFAGASLMSPPAAHAAAPVAPPPSPACPTLPTSSTRSARPSSISAPPNTSASTRAAARRRDAGIPAPLLRRPDGRRADAAAAAAADSSRKSECSAASAPVSSSRTTAMC